MKKLNLIKRLWTDSHEKQKMGGMRRYAAMLMMLLTLGVGQMWAYDPIDVYCAIDDATLGSYNLRCNFNGYGGNNQKWIQCVMTNTGHTYNGKLLYKGTFTPDNDGANYLQFQLYNGDTWVAEYAPINNSWIVTNTFAGKINEYGQTTWNTYGYDLYYVNTNNWAGDIYAYAWNNDDDKNAAWPGAEMTDTGKDVDGHDIYRVIVTKTYAKVIFNCGSDACKTSDLTLGAKTSSQVYNNGNWYPYPTWYWIDGYGNHNGSESGITKQVFEETATAGVYTLTRTISHDQTFHIGNGSYGYGPSSNTDVTGSSSDLGLVKYTPVYWFTFTPANSEVIFTLNTNNMTLSLASVEKYTINYYDEGGSAFSGEHGVDYPTKHTYGSETALVSPTKTGYVFEGWYTNSSCTGDPVTSLGATDYNDAISLYAKWTALPIVYIMKSKGANTRLPHGFTALENASKLTLWAWSTADGNPNFYTSTSYPGPNANDINDTYVDDFGDEWYRFIPNNTSHFNSSTNYGVIVSYNGSEDANKIYESNGDHQYCSDGDNITNCNGTTNNTYTGSVWIIPQGTTQGSAILYTENPATLLWSLHSDGLKVGDFDKIGEDTYQLTVLATAITNYGAVCFSYNGENYKLGNCSLHTEYYSQETAATLTQGPGNFSWTGSPTGQIILTIFKSSGDWKIYYTPSYQVTYDANGATTGSVPTDANYYTSGTSVTIEGNSGNLVKTGYNFAGWNGNASGTGTDYTPAGTFSISDNTTLYAKWTPKNFSITYKDQGDAAFSGVHASGYPTSHTYNTATTLKSASKTGYTFDGWFTSSACTGSAVTELGATDYTADIVLYAKWTINNHNITRTAPSNGSLSIKVGSAEAVNTNTTSNYNETVVLTTTPNFGYYLTSLTVTKTGDPSTVVSVSNNTFTMPDYNVTITATYALRYAVVGSVYGTSVAGSGMPGWSDFTKTLEYDGDNDDFRRTLTIEGNKKYKFRIKDKQTGNILGYSTESAVTLNAAHTTFNQTSADVTFDLASIGSGDVTFLIDGFDSGYPQVRVLCTTTSYQISIGRKATTDGCWTPVDAQGGSFRAEDGCGFEITDGKYVRSGGSVTFTATPATGFQFDGWYNSAELSGLLSMDAEYTISSITSAKTVYAKFKEITFSVWVWDNNNYRFVKVGVKSHPEITAVSPSGQVFARWDVSGSASVTVDDPYSKTTTITAAGDNSGNVIARFQDPPTLYYVIERPTQWSPSTMYVYFYDIDYWDGSLGSGSSSGCLKVDAMTPVEGTNKKWWKYTYNPETDSELRGHTIRTVSFMEKQQIGYDNFSGNTGTHRQYQTCMNMFVVTTASAPSPLNTCYYYNDGYWYNYEGTKSGYYLHGLNDDAELIANESGDYVASVNLEANKDYYFYIGGCDGKNWAHNVVYDANTTGYQVSIYDNISGNSNRIHLKTNAGGLYEFKLSPVYNPDNNNAHMYLDITYPILAGDYRAVNTTPTKDLPSNVISGSSDGDTISLWLQQGNNTIAFKEAAVNGSTGALTWSGSTTQTVNVAKNGVYKMKLSKAAGPTYSVSTPEEYTGKFYIRTDCAPGKWKEYKQNSMTNNTLTFNTADATTYDYYYCKWLKDAGSNVRFVVANKWNIAISDTLIHDDALGAGSEETLPEPASVRFSYNSYTNDVKRAYLSGSTDPNDRFLILHGNVDGSSNPLVLNEDGDAINYSATYDQLGANEAYFEDKENWVYQVNLKAKSGAAVYLTADYNGEDRDLYGSSSDLKPVLTSNNGSNSYPITAIYDFKTNNMMIAWHPGSGAVEDKLSGLSSVMIVRDHQQAADQITFGENGSIAGSRVYGVMRFNKWTLNNQERTGGHATVDPLKSPYERALYWISFPFNVRLKEVFGMGTYGIHWIMEYYDGAGRAERGWWVDSEANWKFYYTDSLQNGGPDGKGTILQANVGYVLGLDLDYFYTYNPDLWGDGAKADDAYLYFPSMSDNITITDVLPTSVSVPAHQCTIDRRINKSVANTNLDRRVVDSHWNVIGVPSYSNITGLDSVSTISNGTENVAYPSGFGFYYKWDMDDNKLDVTAKSDTTVFLTMHGYMLQFTGTINWQTRKASLVAARERKRADHNLRLELLKGTTKQDHALLRITDDEGVTTRYDLNQDLCKESNAGANIWTLTDDTIPVAGNSLPYNEQITIVPVGVQIAADGEYTFSMPEGINGVGVVLIDNIAGTRTSLSLTDYTVNLTAGTYDGRFELEISPIVESPTGIEGVSDQNAKVRKVMVDGILYIVKDGKVFDARGNRVQ